MKTILIFVFMILCLPGYVIRGQEQRLKFIKLEAGTDVVFNQVPDHKYIWGETLDGTEEDLVASAFSGYIGLAFELKSNNKVSFAGGLRYKQLGVTLGTDPMSFGTNYFYVITSQTETTTEYLRVIDILQTTDYLGATADVRWFPFERHRFTFYFKGGLEFDYLLKTETEVTFQNPDMNPYEDEVVKRIKNPAYLTGILHLNTGVEIGKRSKYPFRIEMGPSIFLNQNTSGLIKTIAGFDFGVSIQIPLNHPL